MLLGALTGMTAAANVNEKVLPEAWLTDYREALARGKAEKCQVLLWFFDPRDAEENAKWQAAVLKDEQIQKRLAKLIPLKLPADSMISGSDEKSPAEKLLAHGAFAELLGKPGVAIIDMSDESSPHFHHVVSAYPFVRGPISRDKLTAMLDLPSGSLTQRTLIWAVRTHGDRPRSAAAEYSPLLAAQAASHSQTQAGLNLQGHHSWEQRFHDINSRLGQGMVSREVCAESWPGQRLVEAAEDCVHSWRQSPGHWEAVSGTHACFGYDMRLGSGGVWYATGIFGDRQ